jgi:hypothetical protein
VGTVSAYHILLADGAAVVVALTNELLCPTGKRGSIRHDSFVEGGEIETAQTQRAFNRHQEDLPNHCAGVVVNNLPKITNPGKATATIESVNDSAGFMELYTFNMLSNVLLQRLRIFFVARVLHVGPNLM